MVKKDRKTFLRRYNLFFILRTSILLFPYIFKHFFWRRARRSIPDIGYYLEKENLANRLYNALVDSMYNIILDGYMESTGVKVSAESMTLIYFIGCITFKIDDVFDKQMANNKYRGLNPILEDEMVANSITTLKRFEEYHNCKNDISGYLNDIMKTHFENYAQLCEQATETQDVQHILDCNFFDSGLWLEMFMHSVALFNNLPAMGDKTKMELHNCGMACKLGDEITDIRRDFFDKDPNVLLAILKNNPPEESAFMHNLNNRKCLYLGWWRKKCPKSTLALFEFVEQYYNQLSAPKLRMVIDLMFLPVIIGFDYQRLNR